MKQQAETGTDDGAYARNNGFVTGQSRVTFWKKLLSYFLWDPGLIVGLVVMLSFLFLYVVPRFAELYNSLGAELPETTRLVLAIGTGLQHHAYIVAPITAGGLIILVARRRPHNGANMMSAARYMVLVIMMVALAMFVLASIYLPILSLGSQTR